MPINKVIAGNKAIALNALTGSVANVGAAWSAKGFWRLKDFRDGLSGSQKKTAMRLDTGWETPRQWKAALEFDFQGFEVMQLNPIFTRQ